MCMPALWPKLICPTSRPRFSPAKRSATCRNSQNGCRRNISTMPPARNCSRRSPSCRNTIRPAPSSRSCATAATRSRPSSRRARRWSNSAPAPPPRFGCLLEKCAIGAYVPVDISGDFLKEQADALRRDFPGLAVYPVAADFTAPFALPAAIADMPKVGFFPGSTLGNFEPHEACAFLRSAREILGQGAQMIIGVDLEKDERVLYDAYNDAAGVTAQLQSQCAGAHQPRARRQFRPVGLHPSRDLQPRAAPDRDASDQQEAADRAAARHQSAFRAGESIHTESSYKYSIERFTALARGSGWTPRASWTDPAGMFSVHALVASD